MLQSDGLKVEENKIKDAGQHRGCSSKLEKSRSVDSTPEQLETANKPALIIEEEKAGHNSKPAVSDGLPAIGGTMSDDGSWACPRCTYINYSKSSRCSMCAEQYQPSPGNILDNETKDISPAATSHPAIIDNWGDSPTPSTSNNISYLDSYPLNNRPDSASSIEFSQMETTSCHQRTSSNEAINKDEECISVTNDADILQTNASDTKGNQPTTSNSFENDSTSPHIILDSSQKWPCPRCTYYNWPRSKVCAVCRAPPDWVKKSNESCNNEHFTKSKSPEVVSSDDGSGGSSISSIDRRNTKCTNTISVGLNSKTSASHKWQCSACTYENFWKAMKCSVCGKKRSQNSINNIDDALSGKEKISPPVTLNRKNAPKGANSRNREAVFTIEERMKRLNIRKKSPSFADVKKKAQQLQAVAAAHDQRESMNDYKYFQSNNRFAMSKLDWMFLQACWAVSVGAVEPLEAYLFSGGDKKRILTASEAAVLDIPGVGDRFNLMMIAILFKRARIVEVLMNSDKWSTIGCHVKHPACGVSADLTNQITRTISNSLRWKTGAMKCYVFQDNSQTYVLPAEIHKLPRIVQKQLMSEIIDESVKKELEVENCVVNWNREVTMKLKSKLRPLWNRTAGDCLLDAVLQATWGVFDNQNVLRKALAEALKLATVSAQATNAASVMGPPLVNHPVSVSSNTAGGGGVGAGGISLGTATEQENFVTSNRALYQRWREQEVRNASEAGFTLDSKQLEAEWSTLSRIAAQPGQPLEQLHIFVLAHILRRPIIVYGVKVVKSFRGEEISPAKFEGVYLPLLWEPSFCNRNPICLGYTPGHFSALITLESISALESFTHNFYGVVDPNLSMKMQLDSCYHPSLQHQTNHHSSYNREQQQLHVNPQSNHLHPQMSHQQMSPPSPGQHQYPHTVAPPPSQQQQQFQVPQKFDSPNYYLPLVDCDFKQLPVHFLLNSEAGQEDIVLNQMLDCIVTPGGILVARYLANQMNNSSGVNASASCVASMHPLVSHMNDLWLERYRILASTMNQSSDDDMGHDSGNGGGGQHRLLSSNIH